MYLICWFRDQCLIGVMCSVLHLQLMYIVLNRHITFFFWRPAVTQSKLPVSGQERVPVRLHVVWSCANNWAAPVVGRPVNEKRPGRRAPRPSAGAAGQHAAGGGCGGAGEGRRRCCRSVRCHQLRRDVTRQLARALWLQKQVEPDSQYIPHWAGEVWAGTACNKRRR